MDNDKPSSIYSKVDPPMTIRFNPQEEDPNDDFELPQPTEFRLLGYFTADEDHYFDPPIVVKADRMEPRR